MPAPRRGNQGGRGPRGRRPLHALRPVKVFDPDEEQTLADTVARARAQIEDKGYVAGLVERGIDESRIRTYGIAFRGKEVLVG